MNRVDLKSKQTVNSKVGIGVLKDIQVFLQDLK